MSVSFVARRAGIAPLRSSPGSAAWPRFGRRTLLRRRNAGRRPLEPRRAQDGKDEGSRPLPQGRGRGTGAAHSRHRRRAPDLRLSAASARWQTESCGPSASRSAVANGGVSGEIVRDLMSAAVDGALKAPHRVEWLSDTADTARALGLTLLLTPVRSAKATACRRAS
jgi:hypothetical protein